MKRILNIVAVYGLLFGAAWVVTAQPAMPVVADIPFGFHVGDTWMPAGEYKVMKFTEGLVRVISPDHRDVAYRPAIPLEPVKNDKTVLVFRKYGESRYFLGEVRIEGATGAYFAETRREKEAVKATLLTGNKPTEVIILAYAKK
jgi:hypothetical protein